MRCGKNSTFLQESCNRLIYLYQFFFRLLAGPCGCRFEPSCSNYAIQAFNEHGLVRGGFLTGKRLLKCHPWHTGGSDPVPK